MTPILSRKTEKLIIKDYSLLCLPSDLFVDQFGFRATGSTTCALINITHVASQLFENNMYVRCHIIDFTKAFDTIDHLLLLKKLGDFGLPPLIVKWVVDFLTGRSSNQTRAVAFQLVNYQPPQGSGLGPMLFIIYAADLKAIGVTNHLSKYADDPSLLVPEHCDVSLEQEFVHVCEWAESNKLKLNVSKTKVIVFKRPNALNIVMPPPLTGIDRTEHAKLLGIVIDGCLAFSHQTDLLLQACNQRLYLIKNLRIQGLSKNASI